MKKTSNAAPTGKLKCSRRETRIYTRGKRMTRLFSVYGDSISSFEGILPEGWRVFFEGEQLELTGVKTPADTWWGQVIDHFGGELLANASWSGCVVEGRDFPVGASRERIAYLAPEGTAPDDILVHIGINDYGWGSGYAQICAATPSAPPALAAACPDHGKVAGMAPAGTLDNFEESYRRMLSTMHEFWPDARIWVSTLLPGRVKGADAPTSPRYFRGICVDEYNEIIRTAAKATPGCKLVDMAAFGYDYEAIDGTHPTAQGMKQIAALFLEGMEQGVSASSAKALADTGLFPEDMRSDEFCTKPCVGCSFARGTGNNWWHVCEKQLAE